MEENSGVVKAILFDFDGTLADSYDGIAASVNHVRASHGLPPLSTLEVRRHVGRGVAYLLAHTATFWRSPCHAENPAFDLGRRRLTTRVHPSSHPPGCRKTGLPRAGIYDLPRMVSVSQ